MKKSTSTFPSSHPDYGRSRRLATLFNLTIAEYDAILRFQKGACAICQRYPKTKRLAVDHQHSTGLVRGLLCWQCNKFVLSWVEQRGVDPKRLYDYFARPPATSALGEPRFGRKGKTEVRRSTKRTTAARKRKA